MSKITGSAPILLVNDVVKSAAYFRDKLGFDEPEFYNDPPSFSIISRDGHRVMLAQVDAGTTIVPYWKIVDKMWNIYFWVDDVETLYADFIKRGAIIDYTLYTTPWGTREFGVQDLDDHDIAFGQVVRIT
jgi:hypothetical protein